MFSPRVRAALHVKICGSDEGSIVTKAKSKADEMVCVEGIFQLLDYGVDDFIDYSKEHCICSGWENVSTVRCMARLYEMNDVDALREWDVDMGSCDQ